MYKKARQNQQYFRLWSHVAESRSPCLYIDVTIVVASSQQHVNLQKKTDEYDLSHCKRNIVLSTKPSMPV